MKLRSLLDVQANGMRENIDISSIRLRVIVTSMRGRLDAGTLRNGYEFWFQNFTQNVRKVVFSKAKLFENYFLSHVIKRKKLEIANYRSR